MSKASELSRLVPGKLYRAQNESYELPEVEPLEALNSNEKILGKYLVLETYGTKTKHHFKAMQIVAYVWKYVGVEVEIDC